MKNRILIIFFLFSLPSLGQEYERSVGIRGGLTSGITFKKFLDEEIATEAILGFKKHGLQLTMLRETYRPAMLEFTNNMQVFFGFGGHVGYVYTDRNSMLFRTYYFDSYRYFPVIGLDACLGAEYVFRRIPLAVSLNVKPFFELYIPGFFRLEPGDTALTISYIF
jgi:hypothetical protein